MSTLIAVLGPTAVGKTQLSIRLARHFATCIVSADSRQLYKDLPIGTAAPTPREKAQVPHHLVGTLELTDHYSAARYETEALDLLQNLFTRHPVVVLTGGSMMYVDALCHGLDDIPAVDPKVRNDLDQRYRTQGLDPLLQQLQQLDPAYYKEVDRQNPRRVIHALEVCLTTGRPYSSFRTRQPRPRPFQTIKIGLNRPRPQLYERINQRVVEMMNQGLLEEVRRVYPYRHLNALNTVGYKELFQYFDGTITLPQAVALIQQNTRHYAKRQLTWLRRDPQIQWFHPNQPDQILAYIHNQLLH